MQISKFVINKLDTMYPSLAQYLDVNELGDMGYCFTKEICNTYGYVMEGEAEINGKIISQEQYFSYWSLEPQKITYTGKLVVFTRVGYKGQNCIGGPIEERGRLTYIDGCSDSLLIYPPRFGDPSLNQLYFPNNITQSFHTHPSIRLGVVAKGAGFATLKNGEDEYEITLATGDMFCLEESELHRFRTTAREMTIIIYHPDGDWGPTDHDHVMKNRTYVTK